MVISGHELFTKNSRDIENDLKAFIPERNKGLPGGASLALKDTTQTSCDILPSEVQEDLQKEEILVIIRRVTMGMGSRNPIEKVRTKINTISESLHIRLFIIFAYHCIIISFTSLFLIR